MNVCGDSVLSAQALALQWPDAYMASGLLYLPYGEISEPFTAYINQATGMGQMNLFELACGLQVHIQVA